MIATQPQIEQPTARTVPAAPSRLLSLDVFRGLTIVGMLLVNNIALDTATPDQLKHAEWSGGITFADFVFPWFLLIVGVAVPYAAAAFFKRGGTPFAYYRKALVRAAILFALGCSIDASIYRQLFFGLDVLQLIGLAYFVAVLLYDVPLALRLFVAGLLLMWHWALLRFVPLPGLAAGTFQEGANVVWYIDRVYLEPWHMRGFVSVVPTAALVLIGTAIGDVLRSAAPPAAKVQRLLVASVALIAAGWAWSYDLPFNKPVWTAPYILYSTGWGTAWLAVLYHVVDVRGLQRWAFPLIVYGSNAIAAYYIPIMVKLHALQEWKIKLHDGSNIPLQDALLNFCFWHFGRIPGGWIYTFAYIVFWWLVLLSMYRKRIFWKI